MKNQDVLEAPPLGTAPPAGRPLFVTARDGTRLFVQDWGAGRHVLLLAAWTFFVVAFALGG